ncbi:hypothetical protein Asp14428_28720 [Actinoplanes sp. NBRC 14428]|nr:hypothetical protein Asp14428_28720 [Actinoplanes sp. NBRC 14428]
MRSIRLVLTLPAVAAAMALAACDPAPKTTASTTPPASAPAGAAPTAGADSGPADDAATVKACKDLRKDIDDNADKIAKAEKIGPPAGHIAVSAQWAAGAAAVTAHSIGADEAVGTAAEKVREEMRSLGDKYNESAGAKPSRKKLNDAVKALNAACSAS